MANLLARTASRAIGIRTILLLVVYVKRTAFTLKWDELDDEVGFFGEQLMKNRWI